MCYSYSQDSYPKPIAFEGDTVFVFTELQVRKLAKIGARADALSAENKLLKKQCDLHANRVKQLSGTVDTLEVKVIELQEISSTKDTVINNMHQAFQIQEAEIAELYKDVKRVKRRGNWKAVGFGLGGLGIGIGAGFLIGWLR